MPASKAQQKAVNKYVKANYDLYQIKMPKGKKATIQAHAAAQGQSVNAYINTAIDEKMSREAAGGPTRPTEAGVVSSLPSDALKAAQEAAQTAGEGLPQFLSRAVTTQAQRDALARKMEGGNK